MDVTRFTELKRVGRVTPSPRGDYLAVEVSRLARDESKYVTDLWRVDLDGGSQPHQLTRGESADRSPRFRRDGSLAFISDRPAPSGEGDPRPQVWLLPASGGEPVPLTDEPLGVTDFRFAADANLLVVLAPVLPDVDGDPAAQRAEADARKKRGPSMLRYDDMPVRHWDHWLPAEQPRFFAYDESGKGRRPLTPTATDELRDFGFGLGWDLAADGSALVTEASSKGSDRIHDVRLELIDVASCERRVLASAPRAALSSPRFSPSGQRVAYSHWQRVDGAIELPSVRAVDLEGEPLELSAPALDPKELAFAGEDTVVYSADVAGDVAVFAAVIGGEGYRITAAGGTHGGLSAIESDGGRAVVGTRHTLFHPPEPFLCEVAAGAEPRLIAVLSGASADDFTAIAELERCATRAADGTEIPWFLLKPRGAGSAPALLWIHGGPIGQWSDGWHWRWNPQLMVAAGYAVALPNPRGSTGLGNDFADGVWNNRWGAECYSDLMSVTDDLVARDDIDSERVGAMGGSFGGYMANWIGGNTDRFRCLVSHAGIYHLPAFHGATDHPAFFTHEQGCDPYSDPEAFSRYSPHAFVADWKTPVLIIHGEKDYRVPISEALLLFEALRANGVDAEMAIFPDENHWILKPHNARAWYGEVLRFLEARLG